MDMKIINILSSVPKEILIHCAEIIMAQKAPGTKSEESEESEERETTRECVKVANLRKIYGSDTTFKDWLEDPNNLYVGRAGRIFITENGEKKYFGYDGSKWANPFTVKKYSLDECLRLYQKHMTECIRKDPDTYDLNELKGKRLGCWCDPKDRCHVDVLLELL